jgi:hypothetical protein
MWMLSLPPLLSISGDAGIEIFAGSWIVYSARTGKPQAVVARDMAP